MSEPDNQDQPAEEEIQDLDLDKESDENRELTERVRGGKPRPYS
jgi:hypothetical protein